MKGRKLLRLDAAGLTCVADISALASGECNDMVVDALGRAYIGNFGKDTDLSVKQGGAGGNHYGYAGRESVSRRG